MREASLSEFFPDRYRIKLEAANGIPDIFEIVKEATQEQMGFTRSGLLLGMVELGGNQDHFIGCLHPLGTNMIVMNKLPLQRVNETSPHLYKSYIFHVLLHEYLHTVGIWDEKETRERVLAITKPLFGNDHFATKLAEDIDQLLPFIIYPIKMRLSKGTEIEFVEELDRPPSSGYFA